MEYVPGENLGERLSHDAGVDCERLARELLGALAHIHAAGVVHRDVKPHNVLIAPDGSAKLIDFGIALPEDATALTSTGNLLGTARYVAPEVMAGAPATQLSDLYSCGVVLRDCIGDGSATLRSLVESLSSSDPGARPASATEALARLKRATHVPDRPTERMRIESPATSPPADTRGRTPALLAIVAGIAAVAVAFSVLAGGSGEEPSRDSEARVAESGPQGGQRASQGGQASEARQPAGRRAAASVPAPAGNDPALGSALNEEGFGLLQAGSYEEAVPVLEEAVRAFPPGTEDIDYAYALFNLGNALRLSGRPEEAIPVLEQRLEIPDQTETVQRELALAKEEVD
jgi:serine/threonine protein kinase